MARNYRPGPGRAFGEIDIVAWEGRTLAVVEVKTRRGGFGVPGERVDEAKRLRLRRAASRMWRLESERRRIPPGSRLRMDVVEVWFPTPDRRRGAPRRPVVTIHRDAWSADREVGGDDPVRLMPVGRRGLREAPPLQKRRTQPDSSA